MKYYKPVDVASMLNLTTQTLMLWRKKGIGPEWIKLGQNLTSGQAIPAIPAIPEIHSGNSGNPFRPLKSP